VEAVLTQKGDPWSQDGSLLLVPTFAPLKGTFTPRIIRYVQYTKMPLFCQGKLPSYGHKNTLSLYG
jgi:hypothetical protein